MKDRVRVPRLGVESLPAQGGRVRLDQDAAHHSRVLRLPVGARIELYDGRGNRSEGAIVSARGDEVVCEVSPGRVVPVERRRVVLVQALPRGPRLEAVVRMTTEIGVEAIRLAVSGRSAPLPGAARLRNRMERLGRIAREACAQSGRARSPGIHGPEPLLRAAGGAPGPARRVVFWESSTRTLDQALFGSGAPGISSEEEVWAVVGPEGGLSRDEVAALNAIGYRDAGLGPSIMRVETAAALAVGLVLDRLGRLA